MASLLLAVQLGGCASMGDGALSGAFVDPSIYDLTDCPQLEAERKRLQTRTAELQGLIDKAQTGAAGSVVGELAYRNDYISTRAQAKLADEQWQKNKCVASPAPPAPAPAAPAKRSRGH
ncbi:twin-arginine translocation pathway signal [Rhodopseudomonas boonkerdii]|uniref:twin-arginine translocation pathway signal n=1 Tax=Rhodopseudomonas boonkerdii TaxID=475937 RepID=UPI003221C632